MPRKNTKKKILGRVLGKFVREYEIFVKPRIENGDFEGVFPYIDGIWGDYQKTGGDSRREEGEIVTRAYKKAIDILSGLLDTSVEEVRRLFQDEESRKSLLNRLDTQIGIIEKILGKDKQYMEYRKSLAGRLSLPQKII